MKKCVFILVALLGLSAFAATVNGGTLTISLGSVSVYPDKSTQIVLNYSNASGRVVHSRFLSVDAACTQVTDQFNAVIANPAPASLCTAITSFASNLNSLVTSGAAAGKLDL